MKTIISVQNCYFFEVSDHNCFAQHAGGRLQLLTNLTELESRLDPIHFFRVRRSYLLNLDYVEDIIYWEKGKHLISVQMGEELKEVAMPAIRAVDFREALRINRLHRLGAQEESAD